MYACIRKPYLSSLLIIYISKIILNSLRSSYTEARESLFREIDALSLIITIYFFPPLPNIESFRKISFDLRARPRISLDISRPKKAWYKTIDKSRIADTKLLRIRRR